jgi:DNA-binding HxlR family transcriptional regulator
MVDPDFASESSPLAVALEHVGDRWSLLVVQALLDGPRRFNALTEVVTGIAPNILTDRLRRLERERIIVATPYQQRPLRMSYALTADGRDLASALRMLADWGARRSVDGDAEGASDEQVRHSRCGTPLEARWYCPTCDLGVSDPEAEQTRTV